MSVSRACVNTSVRHSWQQQQSAVTCTSWTLSSIGGGRGLFLLSLADAETLHKICCGSRSETAILIWRSGCFRKVTSVGIRKWEAKGDSSAPKFLCARPSSSETSFGWLSSALTKPVRRSTMSGSNECWWKQSRFAVVVTWRLFSMKSIPADFEDRSISLITQISWKLFYGRGLLRFSAAFSSGTRRLLSTTLNATLPWLSRNIIGRLELDSWWKLASNAKAVCHQNMPEFWHCPWKKGVGLSPVWVSRAHGQKMSTSCLFQEKPSAAFFTNGHDHTPIMTSKCFCRKLCRQFFLFSDIFSQWLSRKKKMCSNLTCRIVIVKDIADSPQGFPAIAEIQTWIVKFFKLYTVSVLFKVLSLHSLCMCGEVFILLYPYVLYSHYTRYLSRSFPSPPCFIVREITIAKGGLSLVVFSCQTFVWCMSQRKIDRARKIFSIIYSPRWK